MGRGWSLRIARHLGVWLARAKLARLEALTVTWAARARTHAHWLADRPFDTLDVARDAAWLRLSWELSRGVARSHLETLDDDDAFWMIRRLPDSWRADGLPVVRVAAGLEPAVRAAAERAALELERVLRRGV